MENSTGASGIDSGTPITWPRTTIASPFYHAVNTSSGDGTEFAQYWYNAELNNSNTITTSYQNIPTSGNAGFEIGAVVGSTSSNTNGSSGDDTGFSTIVEIIVKDLDGGVEHKCDLLIVFAISGLTEANQNDEEDEQP